MTGVLVIGSHRCGTSAVTGILHHLGVEVGGTGNHPPENPRGQFEDNEFVHLNDRMVDWRSGLYKEDATVIDELQQLISRREVTYPLWGCKDPRLCYTACFYLPLMKDPRIILVTRDINAATASLQERSGPACTIKTQADHFRAAYDTVAAFSDVPTLEIRYEQLLQFPLANVSRIMEFLHPPEPDVVAALNHIDRTLQHHL